MPPRAALPLLTRTTDSRAAILQGLLIAAIVVTALYVGRDVLLPLALSIVLAFVLSPALLLLRRIKVPRVAAVAIVVAFAFAIIFALGWLLSREATHLAAELPTYQKALSEKIKGLRGSMSASPVFERAGDVLTDLLDQLVAPQGGTPSTATQTGGTLRNDGGQPIQIEIRPPGSDPTGFEFYRSIAGTVLPPL
ncbi:MAG: AI-2E family transporter, partial [Methyloceanibacter sp.]